MSDSAPIPRLAGDRAWCATAPAAERRAWIVVIGVATLVAALGAQSHVGGWNDGSRLATIESLVDRHTWSIDESFFVRREADATPAQLVAVPDLTLDKLRIGNRFYSDKPPVLALLLAGPYWLWRTAGGAAARLVPDRFCYWMALASAGVGYVVAVGAVFALGGAIGVSLLPRLVLASSLAFATLALPYSRSVNGHIALLAAAAVLFLVLARARGSASAPPRTWLAAGVLAGLAYTLDLAAGPLLLVCVALYAAVRGGRRAVASLLAAALPWVALHHAITWVIGGTLLPLNADPSRFVWPGSPFGGGLTGAWHHDGLLDALIYAAALLLGKRGFLLHNLPLLTALAGAGLVWRQRPREAGLLACGLGWAVATWVACAIASNNYSGECASIRWLLPLLAPGYLALAVVLRERRDWLVFVLVLSVTGMTLAIPMWWRGPWNGRTVPGFWFVQAAALASCVAIRRYRAPRSRFSAPRL
ncbi:MAG: hypothetical protein SF182_27825 [Deltaproteobacteria bacterium]|nr:hypothetical protein [Deltaproteobacteria bacterium]